MLLTEVIGIFFNRKVFDKIWRDNANRNVNGVAIYFARENDYLNLVVEPAYYAGSDITTPSEPGEYQTIFYGQAWCPTHCGFYHDNIFPASQSTPQLTDGTDANGSTEHQ